MGYSIKKVDVNQKEIVKAARATSASVAITSALGNGFPDIVVGCNGLTLIGNFNPKSVKELVAKVKGIKILEGANLLIEIKDGTQPPSKKKLTPDEVDWHKAWQGQISVIESVREMLKLLSSDDKHYEYLCLRAGITAHQK